MVIYCKRPNQIPLIPWEDIHNLSQILHIPGTDSSTILKVATVAATVLAQTMDLYDESLT